MSAEMDRLEQEITELKTVTDSAAALMSGLAQQIRDTAGDRTRALALAQEVENRSAELAQAIVDNTPNPPEPGPTPPEPNPPVGRLGHR